MIRAALEDLDLSAVLAAFREQESHGHTALTDAERHIDLFGEDLCKRAMECRDVVVHGDRQDLRIAYRRAARLAAYAIATMRRIRFEEELPL